MSEQNSNYKDNRSRCWVAVLYPESLPDDWCNYLDDLNVPWCCSPLHDKDIDGDNKPKKAHYHVLMYFSSKKSQDQVKNLIEPLNCPMPQRCFDVRGAVRYMCHMDSPNKYQYSASDVIGHCGFDVGIYLKASTSARYDYIGEMVDFIIEHKITEFIDFFKFAKDKRYDTWYPLLCDNSAIVIKEIIKSNRHRGVSSFIDYDTGELLFDVECDNKELK